VFRLEEEVLQVAEVRYSTPLHNSTCTLRCFNFALIWYLSRLRDMYRVAKNRVISFGKIFKKFSVFEHMHSKFVKSVNMIKKLSKQFHYGVSKNEEFYTDSNFFSMGQKMFRKQFISKTISKK
jgi:hypothetical protein